MIFQAACEKLMLRDVHGQITVFLSMIFLIMTAVSFCVLEGIHGYMESALAEEAFLEAGDEILANYDKYIFTKYHVFFLDPREKAYLESDGREYLKNYMDPDSYFGFTCTELSVTEENTAVDEKGLFLRYQISEYMKNQKIVQAGSELQEMIRSALGISENLQEGKVDFQEQEEKTVSEEEPEEQNAEEQLSSDAIQYRNNWSGLRQILKQLVRSGILLYAVDESGSLSTSSIVSGGLPSGHLGKDFSEKEDRGSFSFSFNSLSEWRTFLKTDDFSEIGSISFTEDAWLLDYLFQCYSRYGGKVQSGKTALQYELEYLISGKKTDLENLRHVSDRILLMRFLMNYGYASHNPDIQMKAGAMAGALTGFLGFPEGEKAVQILLTAALSYGESLLELHTLMNDGAIALTKDSSTWNMTFENAALLLKNKSAVKTGKMVIRYEDYLKLFLSMKLRKELLMYRMMDIMQVNAVLEEPGFRMSDSIFSFEWTAKVHCPRWFVNFPGIQAVDSFFEVKMNRFVGY